MKYKKDLEVEYKYIYSEESQVALNGMFDSLINKIYTNLKVINEMKKEYCSLSTFSAKDYPEFLMIHFILSQPIDVYNCL